jgi:hypothetical protein
MEHREQQEHQEELVPRVPRDSDHRVLRDFRDLLHQVLQV